METNERGRTSNRSDKLGPNEPAASCYSRTASDGIRSRKRKKKWSGHLLQAQAQGEGTGFSQHTSQVQRPPPRFALHRVSLVDGTGAVQKP